MTWHLYMCGQTDKAAECLESSSGLHTYVISLVKLEVLEGDLLVFHLNGLLGRCAATATAHPSRPQLSSENTTSVILHFCV